MLANLPFLVNAEQSLKNLVKYDSFSNVIDTYMALGKRYNKFSSFESVTKQQLVKQIKNATDGKLINAFFEMITNFIHEIMQTLYSSHISLEQIGKREKYSNLYKEITSLKQLALENLKQYSVETVFNWVEHILKTGWKNGNLIEISSKSNHMLKIDVKKLLEKQGFKVVKNDNDNNNSDNKNYNSYGQRRRWEPYNVDRSYGSRYSQGGRWSHSYGSIYGSNRFEKNSYSNSYDRNSRRDRYKQDYDKQEFKLVPGLTKEEQREYEVVLLRDFYPSRRYVIIEFSPTQKLFFIPMSCVDLNVKGKCDRSEGYCRYYCACTICGSTKHGRIHCPMKGSKA